MIKDLCIVVVTVIGSVCVGVVIGVQVGVVLKKCVLELGGLDLFIVFNDVDLELAVKAAVVGCYQNIGQVCVAVKRFIIEEGIVSVFIECFVVVAVVLKMGDFCDEENVFGLMVRFDLCDELYYQVEKILVQGVCLLLGGEKMVGVGNYYSLMVLVNVILEMIVFWEEMFGFVAVIIIVKDVEYVLELVNDSEFGFLAIIFIIDEIQVRQMAVCLECGGVFINGYCVSDV